MNKLLLLSFASVLCISPLMSMQKALEENFNDDSKRQTNIENTCEEEKKSEEEKKMSLEDAIKRIGKELEKCNKQANSCKKFPSEIFSGCKDIINDLMAELHEKSTIYENLISEKVKIQYNEWSASEFNEMIKTLEASFKNLAQKLYLFNEILLQASNTVQELKNLVGRLEDLEKKANQTILEWLKSFFILDKTN